MSTPFAPGSPPRRPMRTSVALEPPPSTAAEPGAATPTRAERIDILARVLPAVVRPPQGYHSEAGLAAMLGVEPRRLRAFRAAGIAGPRRLGRGFVYAAAEATACAVAVRLAELGLPVADIAAFFDGPCGHELCPRAHGACTATDCCGFVLERLARRVEDEISELRRFGRLLTTRDETD